MTCGWKTMISVVVVLVMALQHCSAEDPEAGELRRHLFRRATLRNSPIYFVSTFLRPQKPQRPSPIFSPLLRLPIQYLSNARPVDVVKGMKPSYNKPFKHQYTSKTFLLPLKFLANGKPNNRVFIKSPPYSFRR